MPPLSARGRAERGESLGLSKSGTLRDGLKVGRWSLEPEVVVRSHVPQFRGSSTSQRMRKACHPRAWFTSSRGGCLLTVTSPDWMPCRERQEYPGYRESPPPKKRGDQDDQV